MVDEAEELARERRLRAVRRRARQRAAALGRQRQHGRLPRAARARATRSWACASTRAATSPTARRSTSAARIYDFVAYGVDPESETLDYDEIRDARARPSGRRRSSPAPPPTRGSSTSRAFREHRRRGRRAAASSTPPTSPGSSPAARTRRRCRTPTSSRSPPTRRCAARAAARSSAAPSTAAAIDKAVFPGLQGGPLDARHRGQGGRVPRGGRSPRSPTTRPQIVRNAAALAAGLADEGFRIVSGGTDNHLMLVDLRPFGVTGKVAQEALDRAGITCNKNAIPNDPEKPFVTSGLRLGTAAVTTAGMGEAEMARDRGADRAGAARARRRRRSPATCSDAGARALLQVHAVPGPVPERRRRAGSCAATSLVCGDRRGRHVPPHVRDAVGSRRASARWRCPDPRSVHTDADADARRRGDVRRASSSRCAVASQVDAVPRDVRPTTSEPLGLLLAAAVMFVVGAIDDLRDGVAAGQDRRAGAERQRAVAVRRHDALLPRPVRQLRVRRAVARPRAAGHRDRRRAARQRDQPHRRARRARRRASCSSPRRAMFLYADRLFKAGLLEGSNMAPLVAAITVGVCAGFLPHNFNPARIIMGDAGAMFLGLLLADARPSPSAGAPTGPVQRPDLLLLRAAAHPARDPRRAASSTPRSRSCGASVEGPALRATRPGAPAPPAHAAWATARAAAVVILWAWTALLSAVVLLPTFTEPRQLAGARSGSLALGLLLYIYFHPGVRSAREEAALAEATTAGGRRPRRRSSSSERRSGQERADARKHGRLGDALELRRRGRPVV